jgi:hypothetical protein
MQQQDAILFITTGLRDSNTYVFRAERHWEPERRSLRSRSVSGRESREKRVLRPQTLGFNGSIKDEGAHDRQIESNRISNRPCGYHVVVDPSCLRAGLQEGRSGRACCRKPSKSRRKGLQRRTGSNSNAQTRIRSLGSGAVVRAGKNNDQTESELIRRRGCGRFVEPPSKRRATSCQSDLKMLGERF